VKHNNQWHLKERLKLLKLSRESFFSLQYFRKNIVRGENLSFIFITNFFNAIAPPAAARRPSPPIGAWWAHREKSAGQR
jgi:hypothetical protein